MNEYTLHIHSAHCKLHTATNYKYTFVDCPRYRHSWTVSKVVSPTKFLIPQLSNKHCNKKTTGIISRRENLPMFTTLSWKEQQLCNSAPVRDCKIEYSFFLLQKYPSRDALMAHPMCLYGLQKYNIRSLYRGVGQTWVSESHVITSVIQMITNCFQKKSTIWYLSPIYHIKKWR